MTAISSKEYWEKRAELNLIYNEKSASQYEKQLKKAYEDTIRSIKKEIQAFYQKYSDENGISLASTRKRLKPDEQLDFQKQAKKYLDEIERLGDKAFTEDYRNYLKRLSGKAYISQMDELITNIRHNIETLSVGYNEGFGNTLKDAYEDGYFRTMFDAQKRAGIGISFTTPGGKQLEAAIKEKWLGQNYSDRIWADKKKLVDNLEQLLSQEFVRGRGPNEVAKDLAERLNVSYSNAQRLIRTEINYISNKGSLQAYKDSGIVEKYRYLATLDNRTSDICRELDGRVFDIKEAKVGINLPPMHPYCRSTTTPHFDDDDISQLVEDRIARDKDGEGKNIRLGENLNFFDWVDKYGSESFKQRVKSQRNKYISMNYIPPYFIPESKPTDESIEQELNLELPLTEEEINIIHNKLKDFKDYYVDIDSILMNMEPGYQRILLNTIKKLKTITYFDTGNGAYYTNRAIINGTKRGAVININVKESESQADNFGFSPLTTLFHELGHAISNQMAPGRSSLDSMKKYGLSTAMKKDLDAMLTDKGSERYKEANKWIKKTHKTRGIQDILGGAGNLSYKYKYSGLKIVWGHDDDYWTRYDVEKEMASELFAHLNTMVIDPEVRKIYETLMPESVKVFDDIIKEVGTKQLIKAAKSATKSK